MSLTNPVNIVIFITTTVGLGLVCAVPGILVGKLMANGGMVRDHTTLVVIANVCGIFFARLASPSIPLVYFAMAFAILSPLGIYRADLWTTSYKGRWWWINEISQPKEKLDK